MRNLEHVVSLAGTHDAGVKLHNVRPGAAATLASNIPGPSLVRTIRITTITFIGRR